MSSCSFSGPQSENKRKRKERRIFGPCWRAEEDVEHEVNSDTNSSWPIWTGSQMRQEEMEIRETIETIQTAAVLKSVKILRSVPDT